MADPESTPLLRSGGIVLPQLWDPTLDGGAGNWAVLDPATLAGEGPLAALGGNIPDTIVATGAAAALPAGACPRGLILQAFETNTDVVRWGAAGVGTTSGGRLLPGDSVPIEVADSGAIYVVSATAGQVVAGVRL